MIKCRKYFVFGAVLCSLVGVFFAQPSFAMTTVQSLMTNSGFRDENFFECVLDEYAGANNTTVEAILSVYGASDSLPASGFAAIKRLNCSDQEITDVTGISKLIGLMELDLSSNNISNVDLSGNTELMELLLNDNPISAVDLSNNKYIFIINVLNTRVSTLDLSGVGPYPGYGMSVASGAELVVIANDITVKTSARAKKEGDVYTFKVPEIGDYHWLYKVVPSDDYTYDNSSRTITVTDRTKLVNGFKVRYTDSTTGEIVLEMTLDANPTEVYYSIELADGTESSSDMGPDLAYVGEEWDSDVFFGLVEDVLVANGVKDVKLMGVRAFSNGGNEPNEGVGASVDSTDTHVFGTIPEDLHVLNLKYVIDAKLPGSDGEVDDEGENEDELLPVPDTGFFTGDGLGIKVIAPIAIAVSVVVLGAIVYGVKRLVKRSRF